MVTMPGDGWRLDIYGLPDGWNENEKLRDALQCLADAMDASGYKPRPSNADLKTLAEFGLAVSEHGGAWIKPTPEAAARLVCWNCSRWSQGPDDGLVRGGCSEKGESTGMEDTCEQFMRSKIKKPTER